MVLVAGPGIWSEGIERHGPGSATLCVFKQWVLGKRCHLDGGGAPPLKMKSCIAGLALASGDLQCLTVN